MSINSIKTHKIDIKSLNIINNNKILNHINNNISIDLSLFRVNELFEIRESNDLYGRGMTELRKEYTQNDTKPFPINS